MAHSSLYGPYVRGRLALAGLDSRTPVSVWFDAVYAILAEAPHEVLEHLRDRMVVAEATADPERARETWGLLPDHVAMAGTVADAPPPLQGDETARR